MQNLLFSYFGSATVIYIFTVIRWEYNVEYDQLRQTRRWLLKSIEGSTEQEISVQRMGPQVPCLLSGNFICKKRNSN